MENLNNFFGIFMFKECFSLILIEMDVCVESNV